MAPDTTFTQALAEILKNKCAQLIFWLDERVVPPLERSYINNQYGNYRSLDLSVRRSKPCLIQLQPKT